MDNNNKFHFHLAVKPVWQEQKQISYGTVHEGIRLLIDRLGLFNRLVQYHHYQSSQALSASGFLNALQEFCLFCQNRSEKEIKPFELELLLALSASLQKNASSNEELLLDMEDIRTTITYFDAKTPPK